MAFPLFSAFHEPRFFFSALQEEKYLLELEILAMKSDFSLLILFTCSTMRGVRRIFQRKGMQIELVFSVNCQNERHAFNLFYTQGSNFLPHETMTSKR